MLDTISVAEACVQGKQLNGCSFLLQELFDAYEDVYKWVTHFIYGCIAFMLAMWKWHPPEVWEMVVIIEEQTLDLKYFPW